jgi:glucan phosphoethanolaminetransferase (alkaline phosphatase superfamily)
MHLNFNEPSLLIMSIKWTLAILLIFIVYLHVGVGLVKYSKMLFNRHSTELKLKPFCFNFIFSVAFSLLYFSDNIIIRCFAYSFTFLTFVLFITYEKLHTSGADFNSWLGFELSDASSILMEKNLLGNALCDAFTTYGKVIYPCTLLALVYTTFIWLIVNVIGISVGSYTVSLMPIVVLSIFYAVFNKSGAAINYFPVVLKVPFQLYAAATLPVYRGKREDVTIDFDDKKQCDKLVYIVDESIRGDKLSINGFEMNTTPYLQEIQNSFFNYGVASSASNSSGPSNIMLQTGIRSDQMDQMATLFFKNTNIFQFAKQAGYKTIYIDGQGKGSLLLNYMRSVDFKTIDEAIQMRSKYPDTKRYDIDMKIAEEITSLFTQYSQEKLFIYVLKSGSHFPYESSCPKVDSEMGKVIIKQDKNSDDTLRQLRLNYYSSIKWNVDHFFKTLIPTITQYNPTIIYTSDHGQSLREDGSIATHGVVHGNVYQGIVPLIVFPLGTSYAQFLSLADENYRHNVNKASHFNIFPTILLLLGYSNKDIAKTYEPSLFSKLTSTRSFYTGVVPGNPVYYETKVDEQ